MFKDFMGMTAEGLLQPRQSVRRLLSRPVSLQETWLLIALGYLISAIFLILLPPFGDSGAQGAGHVFGLLGFAFNVMIWSLLAWLPPRLFGGRAEWEEVFPAMAWMSVVTNLLTPLFLIALRMLPLQEVFDAAEADDGEAVTRVIESVSPTTSFLAFTMMMIALIMIIRVFASFVAELHGFQTWSVVAFVVGLVLALSLIF